MGYNQDENWVCLKTDLTGGFNKTDILIREGETSNVFAFPPGTRHTLHSRHPNPHPMNTNVLAAHYVRTYTYVF